MAIDAKTISIYMQVTGPYVAQMGRISASTATFGNTAHASFAKANVGMAKWAATASKIGGFSALAIVAGLALSAKAAITFESSFAGVRKTVDASEAGFKRLADGIREMATEIPIGVNELNRIAELGGQLGVDEQGLLKFTETIALIGVTTTLSTDEAALGFARLDNIMQLNQGSFDRIGSTIVDLGNNFAATEDEILRFALRIAPIGKTVGLTTGEVLALATAFTSVGVPAERGGTAVQKSFIKIAKAVDEGGEALAAFAKTAGMTTEAFSTLFDTDPARAFQAFTEGLADVEKAGGSVFKVLQDVGLGRDRVTQALLAIGNAGDVLADSLELQNDAWMDNNALVEEAEKRFETTKSKLTLLKNQFIDLGIGIGQQLLPGINDFIGGLSAIIDWLKDLNPWILGTTAAVGALGASLWALNKHPIILALTVVAGLIAIIGNAADHAKRRVELMKDELGITASIGFELDDPVAIKDFELVKGLIGEDATKGLLSIGLKPSDVKAAMFGSDAEFEKVKAAVRETYFALSEQRGAVGKEEQFTLQVEAGAEPYLKGFQELVKRRAEIKRVEKEELEFQARLAAARRRQSGAEELEEKLIRSKDIPLADVFQPAFVKPEYIEEVEDALDDYVEMVQDAFDEVEDSIFGNLDAWYEFDDELDVAWDDIIATLLRQVRAMRDINTFLAEAMLAPDVELLFLPVVSEPGVAEDFLALSAEEKAVVIDGFRSVAREARAAVVEEWLRQEPAVKFVAGDQVIQAMRDQVTKMLDDDPSINPASAWFGVIQSTLNNNGPQVRQDILNALAGVFGVGNPIFDDIVITKEQIESVIALLGELTGNYLTTVTVDFNVLGDFDDWKEWKRRDQGELNDKVFQTRNAFGGNILAGTQTLVGEMGPELFIPFSNGTIIPNKELGGSKEVVYNLNVYGSDDTGFDARTVLLTAQTIGSF